MQRYTTMHNAASRNVIPFQKTLLFSSPLFFPKMNDLKIYKNQKKYQLPTYLHPPTICPAPSDEGLPRIVWLWPAPGLRRCTRSSRTSTPSRPKCSTPCGQGAAPQRHALSVAEVGQKYPLSLQGSKSIKGGEEVPMFDVRKPLQRNGFPSPKYP